MDYVLLIISEWKEFVNLLAVAIPIIVVCMVIRSSLWSIGGHHPAGTIVRQVETGLCHRDCKRCACDRADPNDLKEGAR